MVTVLVLAPIAVLLIALSLARLRDPRPSRPAPEPPRIAAVEPAPPDDRDGRGAFAYDNGLMTGEASRS